MHYFIRAMQEKHEQLHHYHIFSFGVELAVIMLIWN